MRRMTLVQLPMLLIHVGQNLKISASLFRLDGTAGGEVSQKYLYILQFRERHTYFTPSSSREKIIIN